MELTADPPRATFEQWRVLAMLVVCVLINYLDRTNLSVAATDLKHDLGLTRFHFRQNPRELPGGHHPGFINDEHIVSPEPIAALRPGQFPRGQRAGLNAR